MHCEVMEKIAIIDCGTNTFHLMIISVEGSNHSIETKFKYPVKIGEGGIENKVITEEAQECALNALIFFKEQIDDYKANTVKATATSAFRNAVNGIEFRNLAFEETGIHIEIIHGDREAELIYKGVKTALEMGKKTSLIMDIGGGSVEFILCNSEKILWKQSFEIGAQRLLDKFQKHDPILKSEIQDLNNYLNDKLSPLFEALKENPTQCLIGSSGSFDIVSEIYYEKENPSFNIHKEASWTIPLSAFDDAHALFLTKNREERLQIPGMIPMRADMIVVATCLIDFIVNKISINTLKVSSFALKEGVLYEYINKN